MKELFVMLLMVLAVAAYLYVKWGPPLPTAPWAPTAFHVGDCIVYRDSSTGKRPKYPVWRILEKTSRGYHAEMWAENDRWYPAPYVLPHDDTFVRVPCPP